MNIYLAVDLGASSGRVMAGIRQDPKDGSSFELREIHRLRIICSVKETASCGIMRDCGMKLRRG